MSKSIKNKVMRGVAWSAVEKFLRQGLMTLFSIFIARQLSPSDYGLVAMLTIFLVVARIFVDSGFVEALIQKQGRTEIDFSTTFWFNIGVSLLIYTVLFLSSPFIADFYGEPLLEDLLIWMALIFVINAFRTVQQAKLNIAMDFRRQAWISIIAISVSGCVGIWMACNDFGVWTLVWQPLLQNFLNVLLLWISAGWIPSFVFSYRSFKDLFGFGSRLLISRTLHAIYTNGSFLLIGKFYSPSVTGLYSQSTQMTSFAPMSINDVVARVAYPIECELQDNEEELQRRFFQMLRMTSFILFPLMMGLAALAEPVVRLLLTNKWIEAVPLIRILCFAWIWWPASNMSWQLLNAKHRSDYCLKAEIIKKVIAISILVFSLFWGIKAVCIGMLIYYVTDVYVITLFTKRILPKVTFWNELKALFPILVCAILMGTGVYSLKYIIDSDIMLLSVGVTVGIVLYVVFTLLTGSRETYYWIELIKKKQ
ncbi:lipopolysaccharide biosynthesis protein [Parabacteroides distasonis]|uniref:Lipopolysaccharide biosynthesis protein n=1 Tax=Parabacteroides distasonis TaxID=823 RepID=A0A7L5E864_PARDI|nr:lipopolysaccharide biosynthesis protein [Parabacteroides distasonis]QJE27327.1 lipopolysaccharide biosynthesis protein [Parabacteroides distasonis]WRY43089.1 lipopolysaccharide biosynthesis protein [Parabacteroides distasonis]